MIFSNGTEAADWLLNNCHKCKKYDAHSAENTECRFGNQVLDGFIGIEPDEELARNYGYEGNAMWLCKNITEHTH